MDRVERHTWNSNIVINDTQNKKLPDSQKTFRNLTLLKALVTHTIFRFIVSYEHGLPKF